MDEGKQQIFKFTKIYLIFIVAGFFIFGTVSGIFIHSFVTKKESTVSGGNVAPVNYVPVSYDEIYDMFACPCCGNPIDSNCCPLAVERKNYADGLIDSGIGRDRVIHQYVKKYGVNSFRNESAREEYRNYLMENAPKDRPIMEISPREIDLGNVSSSAGIIKTTFNIRNTGNTKLVINKIETSCGCTSAYLTIRGVDSPKFGHWMVEPVEPVPEGWEVSLSPGESGILTVEYNTTFHPGDAGLGFAIRTVTIFSNDPIEPDVEVRVLLNQVD